MADWTVGGSPTISESGDYVGITGGNGSYSTSQTISPTSNAIINVTAVWRGRSNTGRQFSNGNGSYFRFGNIVVAQNDQTQKHGYVFTGLDNMSAVEQFSTGVYRKDISELIWLKIDMEINTATNTLTSFTIKSEDEATTYVDLSDVALADADYTTVAFGYRKSGSVSTANAEQLKSVLVTETPQSVSTADYTVSYICGGVTVKESVVRTGVVGTDITIPESDKVVVYLDGKKYIYDSDDASGKTVADGSTDDVTVTFREAYTWDWTITAVDESENVLGVVASGSQFEDEDAKAGYPKAANISGTWYETTDAATYSYKTLKEDSPNADVKYTVSDRIDYFFENDELTVVGKRDDGYVPDRASNYTSVRVGPNGYIYTPALSAGVYTITFSANNSNSGDASLTVGLRDGNGNFIASELKITCPASTSNYSEYETVGFEVPADGYSLQLTNNSTYNSNISVDYILLTKTGEASAINVNATITDAGYATFCSPYALDFSAVSDLEAYIAAKDASNKVTFTKVDNVPANTGVLLKGAAATYSIPTAVSSSTDVSANALIGVLADTKVAAGSFVLKNAAEGVGFYKANNEFTVGANTAYIAALPAGEEARFIGLGDATAIKAVAAENTDNAVYNLAGQRVAKAQKGLYIVGGKKVIK